MYENGVNGTKKHQHQQFWSLNDKEMDKLCSIKEQEIVDLHLNELSKDTDDDADNDDDDDESDSSSSSDDGNDASNKVVFLHSLRLFEKTECGEDHRVKGIVEEKYATIEFNEPYYYLYEQLILGPQKMDGFDHPFWDKYWKFNVIKFAEKEQELIWKITKCHQKLMKNIDEKRKEYEQLLAKCNNNINDSNTTHTK